MGKNEREGATVGGGCWVICWEENKTGGVGIQTGKHKCCHQGMENREWVNYTVQCSDRSW